MLELLRALWMFFVGGLVLVEVVGYIWHRTAEHLGLVGDGIRYRHWVHHELDYPTDNLRPKNVVKYKSAGSWSWYVLALSVIGLAFILLPIRDAVPLTIGGALYAYFVVNYFHEAFHVDNHWLNRFEWFKRLVKLHDIHHWAACNYGIVFFGMDRLLGTLREETPTQKEEIFPGLSL